MIRRSIITLSLLAVLSAGSCSRPALAQRPLVPRNLAPGVLTVIPNKAEDDETFSAPVPLRELIEAVPGLEWTPNYSAKSNTLWEKSQIVILRHDIWSLEFAFKPLRMIYVDVPQPNGKMHRKLLWYMAYRVKNTGAHLGPAAEENDSGNTTYTTAAVNPTIRFFPHAVLEGYILNKETRRYDRKAYLDRVIPVAVPVIQQREDPAITLYDSVSMTRINIPVSTERLDKSVWGVFIWEAIDPRIDYLSIFVQGLTNAFEFESQPSGGYLYRHKTLQLNFWRPGDTEAESEGEIRYGVPIVRDAAQQQRIFSHYGVDERLDHLWLYR